MKGKRHKWICPECGWKNAIWEVSPVGRLIHPQWKYADGIGDLPVADCAWERCRKCGWNIVLTDRIKCLACTACHAKSWHPFRPIYFEKNDRRYYPLEVKS